MKTEKVVWGLVLIFIGGILLLSNFGMIHFYWRSIWQFWPLILIIIGANMLFSRMHSVMGPIVAILITVLVLLFIGYQGITGRYQSPRWFKNNQSGHDNDGNEHDSAPEWGSNTFTEPYLSHAKTAELNITGGASEYILKDTTSNFFDADVKQHFGNYSLQKISHDSTEVLNFRMKDNKKFRFEDVDNNEVWIRINHEPLWDINLSMGAGKADFDLRPFKVRNVLLKGGAAEFDLKLGIPETATALSVETGMANINISVPKEAGCRITVKSGLSSKDFDGFNNQPDGSYTTDNYNAAGKKILISLKGGLSNFEVKRY